MGDYWVWIAVIGAVLGTVILIAHFGKPKCPKCGKRKSFAASKKEVKQERISISKTETIKHYSKDQTLAGKPASVYPESVSTRRYTVPGIRTFFEVTYTCRLCGEKFSQREYTDREV